MKDYVVTKSCYPGVETIEVSISPDGMINPSEFMQKLFEREDIPTLDLGNREGHTGYIDFVCPDEFEGPLAKGTDCNGRPFLCVKMKRTWSKGGISVETLFQRYYGRPNIWTSGGDSIICSSAMTKEDLEWFQKLLRDGRACYRGTHYPEKGESFWGECPDKIVELVQ